jgi:hypothetical protein
MAKIQKNPLNKYPDISGSLESKERKRALNAGRSFAEKIEIVKRLNAAAKLWKDSKIVSSDK